MQGIKKNNATQSLKACFNTLAGVLMVDQLALQGSVHAAEQPVVVPAVSADSASPSSYRVRRGDTLLRIAKRLNLPTQHYYQTALALFLKNPQAFIDYNLHQLIAGKTLRLPQPAEINAITLPQAQKIIHAKTLNRIGRSLAATATPVAPPSPLAQTLLSEIKSASAQQHQLQQALATPAEQMQARRHYLVKLQAQLQQLDDNISRFEQQQVIHQRQLRQLRTQQRAQQAAKRQLQQAHQQLSAAVARTRFLQPRALSWPPASAQTGFFQRIAKLKRQQQPLSPLLTQTEALHCAADLPAAAQVLQQFFAISAPGTQWPDEQLGQQPQRAILHAGSMDIILATLHRTIQRFPTLRQITERVALQWDYCELTNAGSGFYDLSLNQDGLHTRQAALQVPLKWQGFHHWGFGKNPANNAHRYIPMLLKAREPYHAYELFLHQVYRRQCFPHPADGKIYTEISTERALGRTLYPIAVTARSKAYPYHWQPICDLPQINTQPKRLWQAQRLQHSQTKLTQAQQRITALNTQITRLEQQNQQQQRAFQGLNQQIEQEIDALKKAEHLRKNRLKAQYAVLAKLAQLLADKKRQLYPALLHTQMAIAQQQAQKERLLVETALHNAALAMQVHTLAEHKAHSQNQLQNQTQQQVPIPAQQTPHSTRRYARPQQNSKRAITLSPNNTRSEPPQPLLGNVQKSAISFSPDSTAEAFRHPNTPAKVSTKTDGTPPVALDPLLRRLSSTPRIHFSAIPTNTDSRQQPKPLNKKASPKKRNITATALYTLPLSGDKPFGKLNLSWAPKTNWFVRGSAKYDSEQGFTYSWGMGYSDWRPGTTSAQLNNWGPIKPGEGLDLSNAVFSISHKVGAEWLKKNKLSLALGLSKPLSGDLSVNATLQWNPIPNWYFRTTAIQKLAGGPTKWSYGFGHFNWRPGTWRLEYANYADNRYPFDNFHEGAITLSRAWAF